MESDRNRYSDSESEEEELLGFDEEDIIRKSVPGVDTSSEDELYAFYDSDDLVENGNFSALNELHTVNMDSDVDDENGADDLRNNRAWGRERRRFYNTDFVDNDSEDFYEGREVEDAELEQQEGERIQSRLASELNEADFATALRASETQITENEKFEEIARDISSLTTREKLDLMQRESPEFFVLVKDLKSKLNEIDNVLIPILNHFGNRPDTPAPVKFLKKKFLVLTNYCTNITFYLLLKAKRSPVVNHPVLRSLYRYRRVMGEIQELDEAMRPKIEKVLMDIQACDNPALEKLSSELRRKNLLTTIKKAKEGQVNEVVEANTSKNFKESSASTSGIFPSTSAGTSGIFPSTSGIYPSTSAGTSGIFPSTSAGTSGIFPSTSTGRFPSTSGIYPSTSAGTSGIYPSTSAGTSGIYPSTSAGTSGIFPSTSAGTSGVFPSTSGIYPSTSGIFPSTSGIYPSTSGIFPSTSGINKQSRGRKNVNGMNEKPESEILEEEKRAITYKMAKNKGLMPRRNKLQRNPRVKHRNKYRKALIRRRGQVRFARPQIPVYGGEPSGIKANVTKSIKFK